MSTSASRPRLRQVGMTSAEMPRIFLRRQRSRSSDSRKGRKENEDARMPGKKRKTQVLEHPPSRSWLEGMSRHAKKSWAKKESHRKPSQTINKGDISRPLVVDSRLRPDNSLSSDEEAYETSRSTLPSAPLSRSGSVLVTQSSRLQVPQRQDADAKDLQRLMKQAIELKRVSRV